MVISCTAGKGIGHNITTIFVFYLMCYNYVHFSLWQDYVKLLNRLETWWKGQEKTFLIFDVALDQGADPDLVYYWFI